MKTPYVICDEGFALLKIEECNPIYSLTNNKNDSGCVMINEVIRFEPRFSNETPGFPVRTLIQKRTVEAVSDNLGDYCCWLLV